MKTRPKSPDLSSFGQDSSIQGDWTSPSRRKIFNSLPRNNNISNKSPRTPTLTTKVLNNSEELYNRSLTSLKNRTHRQEIKGRSSKNYGTDDDILFQYTGESPKNYKSPSERIMETFDKRSKFISEMQAKEEEKMQRECTFTPTLVSKQTTAFAYDRVKHRCESVHNEIMEPQRLSFIDEKSKEIVGRIDDLEPDIFTRQVRKIYNTKAETPDFVVSPKSPKMTKKQIEECVNRLTAASVQNSDDSETEIQFDCRSTKSISPKTIEKLYQESIRIGANKAREYEQPNYYQKPKMNEKSRKIANRISPNKRDLYEESIKSAENNFKESIAIQRYYEQQEAAEYNLSPSSSYKTNKL